MSTIMPEGESLRKAVKWISNQLGENPTVSVSSLVNEAILRFDLNPKDGKYLINFYHKEKNEE